MDHNIDISLKISVVIAVFNSEEFIKKAIDSVLCQVNILEVIVVNDGSTDRTDAILKEMAEQHLKIKLLYHKDGVNKGRAASRNLGIIHAKGDYIAFLDSDDFYLENRFEKDLKILESNTQIDGVYNALGVHFYRNYTVEEFERLKLTSIKIANIQPDDLFVHMSPIGGDGYFSGDALIVRREVFNKVGLFNEKLKVCEDTELWLRLAAMCRLAPGVIDRPVVMRGVHEDNVFTKHALYDTYRLLAYKEFFHWLQIHMNNDKVKIGLTWKLLYACFSKTNAKGTVLKRVFKDLLFTMKYLTSYPSLASNSIFIRNNIFATIYRRLKAI